MHFNRQKITRVLLAPLERVLAPNCHAVPEQIYGGKEGFLAAGNNWDDFTVVTVVLNIICQGQIKISS